MDNSKPPLPLPIVYNQHGEILDPFTGNPLEDGQEEPGSIFYVPSQARKLPDYMINGEPFSEFMKKLRESGFKGHTVGVFTSGDRDRVPSPPPPQLDETSSAGVEIVRGEEREWGFTLREIKQAAESGCDTCSVLCAGITRFADIIFPHQKYECGRVRVRQGDSHGRCRPIVSKQLSETGEVTACFDEFGGETIALSWTTSPPSEKSRRKRNGSTRIMDTSSDATILLIKDWLRTCGNEHPQCAVPPMPALPLRVLGVSGSSVRLIETNGMAGQYTTLSHCWGSTPIIKLLSSNMDDYKAGIPWMSLSKVFQDAVTVTRKLGFHYIWIDALCIAQDIADDWVFHASRMAAIYSNSQLTIAASRAADGAQGCFSRRPDEPYVLHSFDSREIRKPALFAPVQLQGADRDGCEKTFIVSLKAQHGLYQGRQPREPLLKRAWVFQEQILSPRIVHFASGELYFECRSHVACECAGWAPRSLSSQWETRWRKAHAVLSNHDDNDTSGQTIESPSPPASETETETDTAAEQQTLALEKSMERRTMEFEAYRALVEAYTELDISVELDRLPALSGITSGRDSMGSDQYLAGMWRSFLVESLHWYPRATTTTHNGAAPRVARRPLAYRAPSWSWASMEAPIRHAETDFVRGTRVVATVCEAATTPSGLDPRGAVVGGYLRIQGPMAEARVTEIGMCERKGSHVQEMLKSLERAPNYADFVDFGRRTSRWDRDNGQDFCAYATLRTSDEGKEGRCYLDCPLVLPRASPAEVAVGEEVLLLVISSHMTMVLKAAPAAPGLYTRVGLLRLEEGGWLFDAGRESIHII